MAPQQPETPESGRSRPPSPTPLEPHCPTAADIATCFSACLRATTQARSGDPDDEFGLHLIHEVDLDDHLTEKLVEEIRAASKRHQDLAGRLAQAAAHLARSQVVTLTDQSGNHVPGRVYRDTYVAAATLLIRLLAKRCGYRLRDEDSQGEVHRALSVRACRTLTVEEALRHCLERVPATADNADARDDEPPPDAPRIYLSGPKTRCKDPAAFVARLRAAEAALRRIGFRVDLVGVGQDRDHTDPKAYTRRQRHNAARADACVYLTDDEASVGAGKLFTWMEDALSPIQAVPRTRDDLSQLQAGSVGYSEDPADDDEEEIAIVLKFAEDNRYRLGQHASARRQVEMRLRAALSDAFKKAKDAPPNRWSQAGIDRDYALELLADPAVFAAGANLLVYNALADVLGDRVVNDLIRRGRGVGADDETWPKHMGRVLKFSALQGLVNASEEGDWTREEITDVLAYALAPPRGEGSDHEFRASTSADFVRIYQIVKPT